MSSDDRNRAAKKRSRQETTKQSAGSETGENAAKELETALLDQRDASAAAQAAEPASNSEESPEPPGTAADDDQKPAKRKSLAARIGSTVARQIAGALQPGETGSLIGQIGTALIGAAQGEDTEDDSKSPPEGGAVGNADVPVAQMDPVVDQMLSTIACSAVHGLRRAAAAKSIPVKIFWTVMVFLSIGLFLRGAVILSMRLVYLRLEKTYQLDKVPFVFPDLYFCPSNPYSGSFPYTLNETQVAEINNEVDRLGKLFDQQFPTSGHDNSSKTRVWLIQQSMPVHLLRKFIMERARQSLFFTPMITNVGKVGYEVVVLPTNKLCFKTILTEEQRSLLVNRQNSEDLRLALYTDPYYPSFKYNGHQIKPIKNPILNESIPFRVWYPSGIIKMMGFGYTMLIVPQGVYPSMEYETKFKLATGKSYDISIHMEENRFNDELWGSHCSPDPPNADFVDHLTGSKVEYTYSYDACYYIEFARSLNSVAGYIQQGFPVAWDLRNSPRWGNLTENARINRSKAEYAADCAKALALVEPTQICGRRQPCVRNKYTASFSFHNWPNLGGSYASAFRDSNPADRPAIAQIAKIAHELDTGNVSFQSEAEFRHIISDSMLEIRVRAASALAGRLLTTASYSVTSFMSDLGGLMGLYLGCSVLTLFELLEILYGRVDSAVRIRIRKRRHPAGNAPGDEVEVELEVIDDNEPRNAGESVVSGV